MTNQASSVARGLCRVVACASAMVGALPVLADVQCHPDLAAAQAAASGSHKPVLLIFTASWSPESNRFVEHTLASPEAGALIAACFEPVLVDVDAAADLTKRLQISHVPSGCVLGADSGPVATFDCPEPPAAFVAAAARAAQTAAAFTTAAAAGDPSHASSAATATPRSAADLAAAGGFAAAAGDGGPLSSEGDASAGTSAGRGSISLVTAKVRQLSDFATSSPAAKAVTTIAMADSHPPAAAPAPTD
ncbi:MAG: thioredoxin family protein, partial [Pirellulales bacterium]